MVNKFQHMVEWADRPRKMLRNAKGDSRIPQVLGLKPASLERPTYTISDAYQTNPSPDHTRIPNFEASGSSGPRPGKQ